MNDFTNLITATQVQRDYKSIADKARSMNETALIVMSNNRPDLAIMKYDLYKELIENKNKNVKEVKQAKKTGLDAVFGMWTKDEAEEFNKVVDEMNERIDPKDWK